MANSERKMATLRTIDAITPIEHADRIELAHIGGWNVVVKKNEFKPGDAVIFFEIDSFLPADDEHYAFLAASQKPKTMLVQNDDGSTTELSGFVLRTMKLRGIFSQGLVLPPAEFGIDDISVFGDISKHPDVSNICHVIEYVPPMAVGSVDAIGRFSERYAHRTDAVRIQNISDDAWQAMKQLPFRATVKIDGTSTTLRADPDRLMHVYGHSRELSIADGTFGKQILDAYDAAGLVDWCKAHPDCTVQGEFAGPKVSGNRLALIEPRVFAFAVWQRDGDAYRHKVDAYADGFAETFKKSFVPVPDGPDGNPLTSLDWFSTPDELIDFVNNHARDYVTKNKLDEGFVLHFIDDDSEAARMLRNEIGENMEVKIVSNRYLAKHKE